MLKLLILWKVVKTSFLIAFIFSLILFTVQIFHFGFVIFGLPPETSFPFFIGWFSYYTYFFLVDGLIAGTALTLFELKERKLLHIIYSFKKSPLYIFGIFTIPASLIFIITATFAPFVYEERVAFMKKVLALEYKDRLFSNTPEKTFFGTKDTVIYVEKKRENILESVFFKHHDTEIVAQRAEYLGEGKFEFIKGSFVTKEKEKFLILEFERYVLDTEEDVFLKLREKRLRRDLIINAVNILMTPIFFFLSFFFTLKVCKTHTQVNYLIALLIILHQIIINTVKVNL